MISRDLRFFILLAYGVLNFILAGSRINAGDFQAEVFHCAVSGFCLWALVREGGIE